MSKILHPDTEPSVSCGFFNSNNDRKYDAEQMSSIFDGIISDGIFTTIGSAFVVTADPDNANTVLIGTGKCWFNHTWTLNEAILPIVLPDAEVIADANRIDAIVIEVNSSIDVRDNSIKYICGEAGKYPLKPIIINNNEVHQYPLCYIDRPAKSTDIRQDDITDTRMSNNMFVTGILEQVDGSDLFLQWKAQLDTFLASEKANFSSEISTFIANQESSFNSWYSEMKLLMNDISNELNVWSEAERTDILDWFDHMKEQLSTDAAANLQLQIDDHLKSEYLTQGFKRYSKTISEDGRTITTVDLDNGYILVKVFNDDFSICVTTLKGTSGNTIGTLTKEFSNNGNTIMCS